MKQLKKNLALYICMFLAVFCAMTLRTEAANVRTGTLGDNDGITWTYDEDTKTLTITGEDSGLEGEYRNKTHTSQFYDICSDVEVIKVENCTLKGSAYAMFAKLESLRSIEFNNVSTVNVTDMEGMFYNCSSLSGLDLSSFDTSNVTDMRDMFRGCNGLSSLNVSSFNTSKVTDMADMFSGCGGLSSLDVSNLDTSKVTDMSYMFAGCGSNSLNLSNFNTSNVTNMSHMFSYSKLNSLDVSGFDTLKVTDMSYMFCECSNLKSLDLSSFDTPELINIECMFRLCSSLNSLDLSNFDTSKLTDMSYMFTSCGKLNSLDLSSFDTSNVTDMTGMFYWCSSLSSLDVSSFDTSKVTNMFLMFYECSSLSSLDLSSFDTSNVTSMGSMFYGCINLTSLDLSNFDTSKVTSMGRMFYDCNSLTSLDVSNFDTSNVTNMWRMFKKCSSLSSLDVSGFDTSNVTNMECMFCTCSSLTSLDVSGFDTSCVTDMSDMFYKCSNISSLDVSGFNTSNVTDMAGLFCYCSGLRYLDLSGFDLTKAKTADLLYSCKKLACIKTPQTMPQSSSSIYLPTTFVNSEGEQTKKITKDFCNTTLFNVDYLVSEIKIEPSSINVNVGESAQLTATISPEDTYNKTLTWKSSDTAVATVDENGKVTAVAPGTATITATSTDGSKKSASCTVTVTEAMNEQEKQVRAFVERMYTVALGRASDTDGLDFYTEKLLSGDFDGASVAQCFLCSPEFLNKGYDDAQYVKVLYKTFFDREPATEEVNFWVGQINSGKTRMFVLAGFVNSVEFDDLCASYGISRGYMCEDGNPINPGIGRFAERLYTVVLERAGEKEGIEFWSLSIANGVCTPKDAAKKFFLSEEYINKNTSDTKYITTLYKAFMDREPEDGGVEFWQGVLNDGATREQILEGFADSEEFKGIMASFGLQ